MQRAQHAQKLASLSSKWKLTNLPDVKAWEIRREDITICKRPDGSDHELGSGAYGKVSSILRNCGRASVHTTQEGLWHCSACKTWPSANAPTARTTSLAAAPMARCILGPLD